MKKNKLYKLVKEQLKITIKEQVVKKPHQKSNQKRLNRLFTEASRKNK